MLQRVIPNTGRADVDRLPQNFFGHLISPASSSWSFGPLGPRVSSDSCFGMDIGVVTIDVREKDDKIIVTADLPGIDSKDIKVEVDKNILRLETTVKESNEQDSNGYVVRERKTGSMQRSVHLTSEVDIEKATSTYKDGVLEIILPKVEKAKVKQIVVN